MPPAVISGDCDAEGEDASVVERTPASTVVTVADVEVVPIRLMDGGVGSGAHAAVTPTMATMSQHRTSSAYRHRRPAPRRLVGKW
jgi:hypothetical protein